MSRNEYYKNWRKKNRIEVKLYNANRRPPKLVWGQCPKCRSQNSVQHTDADLTAEGNCVWQCFDCDNFWEGKL